MLLHAFKNLQKYIAFLHAAVFLS